MSIMADPVTYLMFFEAGNEEQANIRAKEYYKKLSESVYNTTEEELLKEAKFLAIDLKNTIADLNKANFDKKSAWGILKKTHDYLNKFCKYKSHHKIPQDYVHKSTIEILDLLQSIKSLPEIAKEKFNDIKEIAGLLKKNCTGIYIDILNFD